MTEREVLAARRRGLSPDQLARFQARVAGAIHEVQGAKKIQRIPKGTPIPLSSVQERLWFLNQFEPRPDLYNRPANLRLQGRLDVAALRHALGEIVRRHEVLRCRIVLPDDSPILEIVPDFELAMDEVDLQAWPSDAREAEARRRLNAENLRAFDLATGPLVRACLLRLHDGEHWLAVTFHHVVFDGWSEGVLWRELGTLYGTFVAGQSSPLAELAVGYADFAVWQQGCLEGEGIRRDLAYWRQRLKGGRSMLDLPTDFPRPKESSNRGGHHPMRIEGALVEALREVGHQEGATLFMTLLAAYQVLLSRLAGQEEVCVGTPIAGRSLPELEDLIGCFINTLVLRTDLSGAPTFRGLLRQVREVTLGAYAHQGLPFERLVADLNPVRRLDRTPLFEAMLVLTNTPRHTLEFPGLQAGRIEPETRSAKFDLTLALHPEGPALVGVIEYAADLHRPETIALLARRLQTLLLGIVADPDQRIDSLPILAESERTHLLTDGIQSPAGPRSPAGESLPFSPEERRPANRPHPNLCDLFEAQLRRTPLAEAVIFGAERLSYRDLFQRADALADRLRSLGVGPDMLVGLCVERSIEMLVALLGILRAGGAYFPLDPAYPAARLAFILADADPRVLVTQERLAASLPAHAAQVVCIDSPADPPPSDFKNHGDPVSTDDGESLAYVLYTSGSTGQPKGVQIPRSALVNFLLSMVRQPGMGPHDRMLALTTLGFDIAGLELFLPLVAGGCVVIANRETAADGVRLSRFITDSGVTILQATPATWRMLVEAGWSGDPTLRILCGGESLPRDLAGQLLSRCGELWNLYGPTETTIYSLLWRVQPDQPIVIGRPIDNTQAYVLDADRQPVPVGVVGELHLGGAGLARGYLNRPDLTAERFVRHRFAEGAPQVRLYRTGDRARWRADGTLEFFGRLDHQIKLRGFRIELGEIETVLATAPGVATSVVLLREDVPGNPGLVAYVVPRAPGDPPDTSVLRRHLQAVLPDYMVPTVWVVIDTLPLSPSGKVNRNALPPPTEVAPTEARLPELPRTPAEELLVEIWREVLGVSAVAVHDHFFELGGHSLLAMRVVARIRDAFGVELPVRVLFEHPTLADLAQRLGARSADDLPPPIVPHRTGWEKDGIPLSFAQERMWFLDRLEGDSTNYHLTQVLRLKGGLDADALERALSAIVRRHEALRTACMTIEGQLRGVMLDPGRFRLQRTSLLDVAAPGRDAEALRRAEDEARRPFDLSCELMLRARLFQLADQDHLLVLTLHHIATDGWSWGVFARELSALHRAFTEGKPSPLPELPVQYADYALWQRQWLQGEVLERQLAYWKRQLANLPAVLPLPTDFPRPTASLYQGGRIDVVLEPALSQAIHHLARRENATPFMVLLASWQVLLGRYSGQVDVGVGSPIAGRTRTEIEGLIGFFANTLVLRTDLSGNPTFRELLGRVRETTLAAYAHQDLPFEKLVAELSPQRSLGHSPLFQVMFVLQNAPAATLELGALTVERLEVQNNTAKFDLTLSLAERDGQLRGTLEYSSDLFEPATIQRMIGHFQSLLEGIVRDAGQPIGLLPMLSSDERHRLLHDWSQAPAGPPCLADGLPALFEAQVGRTPDAVAVVFGSETLTYRELSTRANRLAQQLRRLGAGPDVPIGLCLDRSLGLAIGILGILKAGSAYVPLDPAYPSQRLEVMVQEASLRLFVTQESLRHRLPSGAGSMVSLDDPGYPTVSEVSEEPRPEILREHLAYVMFTSGSTGVPKGVAMPRGALANLIAWHLADPRLGRPARTLQFASCNFDVSFQEMLTTWCAGGALVMIPEDTRRDPRALWQFLVEQRIERLFVPFVALQQLATWATDEALAGSRIQDIISAGETLQLTPEIRRLAGGLAGCRFHNHYGPTESHVVTAHVLSGAPQDWPSAAPIGRPIANTRIHLLDGWHQPVPIGVAGELYIGGAALARGYFGRPDLTAERFVPSPLGDTPDGRLYRSGDLARWTKDGTLEFLGRADRQVKVRGYRIEPEEIEAVLGHHPDVLQVAVVVHDLGERGPGLVAYLVTRPGSTAPSQESLRRQVRLTLPEYMVPAAFVCLDSLPTTRNGKIDRKALPPPPEDSRVEASALDLPRTAAEELLAGIWSEVLGLKSVGLHDHFFELGGHSLMAMRVIAQIRDRFGIELPVRTLFEAPSIAQLAAHISRALAGDSATQMSPRRPALREGILPLSFAQERVWFLDQLDGGSTNHHLTQALRLHGPLDPAALEQALAEIVRRHEALRTACVPVDGRPHAVVLDAGRFRLEQTSLTGLAASDREIEARKQATEEIRRPFDLSRDFLLRARCFALDDEDHLLVVTFHHIASDGWSLGIFARELSVLYSAFSQGRPSPLPELPVQFVDFAAWQRQWLQGEVLERQLAFWRTQLDGAPALLELPTDFPRPAVARHRGNRCRIHFGPDLTRSIHSLARREGATPFMVLLAAWQTLLARLSGQDDVTVGVPIAGRNRTEVEGLIGFFAKTLVLRTGFPGNPTFRQCLQRVRETTLAAYAHPDLPFEKLVEELRPERSLAHTPLFQVAFTFQNTPGETLTLPGITLERVHLESPTSQFDLTLSLGERDGQLQGQLGYDSDLFEPETIERWIGHFQCLLEGVVTEPDRPIADLPLMTEAERNQVVHEWSRTGAPAARRCSVPEVATPSVGAGGPPIPTPDAGPLPSAGVSPTPPPEGRRPTTTHLHALFAAQVDRTPDAVALLCGDTSLSYRELHTRAIALASLLRSRGVARGTAVALHLDRSIDFGVAVLAILHAGGCYVPLPLEYPAARLRFMLEDSRSTLVLSRGPLPAELCPPGCQGLDLAGTGGPPIPPFVGHLDAHASEGASTNPRIHDGSTHPDPGFVDSWIRGCHPLSPQGADPAYVMYTSGSTGNPKGVVIPHRAVARLVLGQSFAEFGPSLRTLLLAPLAFDASTFEFWAPLLHGGTCVVYPDRNVDPESLERVLRHGRVNCVFLTSALFNQLLDLRPSALESVAHLLTGGEVISLPHVLKARTLLPHTRLTHCYGPTECTTFATTHAIAPEEAFTRGSVSIGRPISHTSAYVLDARRQPVPIGIPGELYLGGDGLALGYLGHPELTVERFVPDPFDRKTTGEPDETQASKEGQRTPAVLSSPFVSFGHPPSLAASSLEARLYRTGDRVRWSAEGTLEFLGRYDDQVKIRGFRIEPAEIVGALRRHPSVREAWVVVRAGPDGAKRLAAWCQTAAGATTTAADLRSFLRQSLPEYLIPAVTVSTERVPLTPNGKIDASALSVGSDERTSEAASDPGTTTEAMMADLWCRLLGLKRVGPDENFFDLGGHSLLSLQLLEQIHRVFAVRITPRGFFENPTVRQLAARVWDETVRPGKSRNHSPDQRLVALQSGGSQPPIFVFPGGYGDESELITPAWMSRRYLGPDQPLYALLSPGVDASLPHHHTLAAEARDCLAEMRRVHPHGPWFLIGMCVGGNLAYEVARQAQEAGESVPMLALADCGRPGRAGYLRTCLRDPQRGQRQFLMNWLYRRMPWARGMLTSTGRARQWERWFGTDSGTAAIPGVPDKEWEWRAYQHGEAVLSRQWSPPRGRFRGRIDLVTSEETQHDPRIHLWRENATEGTELLVLPGTHSTYLVEGAPLLADLCRRRIEGGA